MSEARFDRISNENNTAGPIISGITTFSGQNFFVPPKGTTAQRPSNCPPGSIRFNTDSAKLEYFDNLQWLEMEAFNVEIGISTNAAGTSGGLGNRGIIGGGYAPSPIATTSIIDYVTISSTGNSISFGNLTSSRRGSSPFSSSTRGIFAGGYTTGIDYINISSTGSGTSFGTISQNRAHIAGISNSTRGILVGGYVLPATGGTNAIEYVTIASTGNPVDFGDLSATNYFSGGCGSSTRGLIASFSAPAFNKNTIEFITISTLGNAVDFGDLTTVRRLDSNSSLSNAIRAIFGGGYIGPGGSKNTIDYVTIASLGNAVDFGDDIASVEYRTGTSSSTRGIFAGGGYVGVETNIIDYITIMTTGNAIDFGDLFTARFQAGALSNGHGGL